MINIFKLIALLFGIYLMIVIIIGFASIIIRILIPVALVASTVYGIVVFARRFLL